MRVNCIDSRGCSVRWLSARPANPGEASPAASTVAIVEDVSRHPGASITQIAARTRLAQSLVSRTVVTLERRGLVLVRADPADARRTLVELNPETQRDFLSRGDRPIADALAELRPQLTASRRARVEKALDLLAAELLDAEVDAPATAEPSL